MEPEEVRRRIDPGRLKRAGGAVDEGPVGNRLGVVADRDPLGAGERADHEVDPVLLDQLACLAHGGVGAGVSRRDDGLDPPARDRVVDGPQRELDAANAVPAAFRERALEGDEDADPNRFLLRRGRPGHGKSHRDCGRSREESPSHPFLPMSPIPPFGRARALSSPPRAWSRAESFSRCKHEALGTTSL